MSMSAEPLSNRKTSPFELSLLARLREQVARCSDALVAKRREALKWLENQGMPSAKLEAWRNASITELLESSFDVPAVAALPSSLTNYVQRDDSACAATLYIINGVAMTDAAPIRGVRWLPLAQAIEREPIVREQLGSIAPLEDGFVAANLASFNDGWCIIVDAGVAVDSPIEICVLTSSDQAKIACTSRVIVLVGEASQLRLVERHGSESRGASLTNLVTELRLERGATVEHARWVDHGTLAWSIATTAVSVGEDATYRSWSASGRGRFVRHDLAVRLVGRRATAELDGLYFGRSGEVADQHVRVWHEQPEGVTKECYRGVIENHGRASFDGIIYVGRGAMKTDARQENRNLLLGKDAIAHTKPHLEIDADDVTCSHGATVGQLDEQQLFYLRSRGIEAATAREVLTWAFAKEIVDRCPNPTLRTLVERSLHAVEGTDSVTLVNAGRSGM